ncbi:MAG: hypothetical protein JF599_06310 [Verrucomicrobia bacterium]|nr:hypothetical protein [Verrucomicrobiota bacterium]
MSFSNPALRALDGRSVLVKPEISDSPNSVGKRGCLRVVDDLELPGYLKVEIVIEFPEMSDMNGLPAHQEIIPLTAHELTELLASENGGAYSFTQRNVDGPTESL